MKPYSNKYNTKTKNIREAEVWAEDFNDIASDIERLEESINYWYGFKHWEVDDSYERTGGLAGIDPCTTQDYSPVSDNLMPIHSAMRRCMLTDAGEVNYYLGATDSTKKADGTDAVLDGTDGQMMVEIPKFYYRYSEESGVKQYDISKNPISGFSVHPAFLLSGAEVDFVYFGAFKASLSAENKLESLSSKDMKVSTTRASFRTYARNRATGWEQRNFWIDHAVKLLWSIEYCNFNSQAVMSEGITNADSGDWSAYNSYNPLFQTGHSLSLGNATGETDLSIENFVGGSATLNTKGFSWRGIEDFYGHIWEWCDGINVTERVAYQTSLRANFVDDTISGYEEIGLMGTTSGGYAKTSISDSFLGEDTAGGSDTYFCDAYYTNTGWRVVHVGGLAINGSKAGVFCVYSKYDSSLVYAHVGGRLCFVG